MLHLSFRPSSFSVLRIGLDRINFESFFMEKGRALVLIAAIALCSVGLPYPTRCFAAEVEAGQKVATVDLQRVLNETSLAKSKKQGVDALAQSARKKLDERRVALEARQTKLKAAKVAEGSPEVAEYQKDAREFTRLVKDAEDEVRAAFMKSNRELTEAALKAIESYAKKEGYNLVLEHTAESQSSVAHGAVLFAEQGYDITDPVIQILESGNKKG